jgi:hypothetical protein
MVRDGSGSQNLIGVLEEAARGYETGAKVDRTDVEKELRLVKEAVSEDQGQGDLFAEDKGMSTATTRTTAARFQAYLKSAEVARLKAKTQIKEVATEDKKQTVDVERSLGLIDAHIAQMQKRMDESSIGGAGG